MRKLVKELKVSYFYDANVVCCKAYVNTTFDCIIFWTGHFLKSKNIHWKHHKKIIKDENEKRKRIIFESI